MKKKKQLEKFVQFINNEAQRNSDLLTDNTRLDLENARLGSMLFHLREGNRLLKEENSKLKLENDLARAQLLDLQEKMRKPVFVPVK